MDHLAHSRVEDKKRVGSRNTMDTFERSFIPSAVAPRNTVDMPIRSSDQVGDFTCARNRDSFEQLLLLTWIPNKELRFCLRRVAAATTNDTSTSSTFFSRIR